MSLKALIVLHLNTKHAIPVRESRSNVMCEKAREAAVTRAICRDRYVSKLTVVRVQYNCSFMEEGGGEHSQLHLAVNHSASHARAFKQSCAKTLISTGRSDICFLVSHAKPLNCACPCDVGPNCELTNDHG